MTSLGSDGIVQFRFFRPGAREVGLAGDFHPNGWDQPLRMDPDGDNGWWVARVELAPGEYRFRYVADDAWYTDFASNGIELNEFGWDSLLYVPERAERHHAAATAAALRVA
jgi:1,4-alpha-glucan branching enzyme